MDEAIVCMRIENIKGCRVPNAGDEVCVLCGAKVSAAPSSYDYRKDHPDAPFICVECAVKEAQESDEEIVVEPLTEAQRKELQDYYHRN